MVGIRSTTSSKIHSTHPSSSNSVLSTTTINIISVKITVSLKVGKVDEAKVPNCNFSGKRKLTPMSPRVSFSS